MLLQLLL
jgi:hypothetical protein